MRDNNESEFFKHIQPNILKLEKALQDINSNLNHHGIELFSRGKGQGSLTQQFQKVPGGVGVFPTIEGYIIESLEIVEKLREYRSHSILSLENDRAQRKAERQDAWILWSQRLVRWTLGAISAVVLYSAIIWASEKSDFIKIPVKDWFHQSKSEKSSQNFAA